MSIIPSGGSVRRSDTMDLLEWNHYIDEEFTLLETIGYGGYGEVYAAEKRHSGELVAIKATYIDYGDDIQKPLEEVRLLKECEHENLIKFYAAYLQEDETSTLFIAMEYCGGGSLSVLYKDWGAFGEDETAFVCREVLRGLQYLHGIGILHRDIKGDNVLINDAGVVKICDLGVAARLSDPIARFQTAGTLSWMAPEVFCPQMNGGYDERCDIWSLGLMAVEVAEAQIPFYSMSLNWIAANRASAYMNLKKVHWSLEFKDFVYQALIPDPRRRPSAKELLMRPFVNRPHLTGFVMERRLEQQKNQMLNFLPEQDFEEEEQELEQRLVPDEERWPAPDKDETAPDEDETAPDEDETARDGRPAPGEDETARDGRPAPGEDETARDGRPAPGEDETARDGRPAPGEDETARDGRPAPGEDETARDGRPAPGEDETAREGRPRSRRGRDCS
ncbi:mitogen-activated protein kinase kinase kinase kinase 5-like [Denticeps clupeoides]|uniref:mitogen-activated protein kinase kinase kinase kinase 5-like n=1 Tax=Denticeps clupeoides TaxID=299321 RepID=UPI0010A59A4D|nr:mitogen-activated protein kinase kinase kinase kinase 5-like [Denticeps clupeoides]